MSEAPRLQGRIGRFQYLALGFGTMIGSAWVILLGDWLGKAGPGGAVLGFLAGGIVVMLVGACYAELAGHLPEAGSEFIYARRVYGAGLGFTVGWFLVLYLLSVTVFEAIAFAWIFSTVAPGLVPDLVVGIAGALLIGGLNYRGAQLAVISHTILTYAFAVVVAGILLALMANGSARNLSPLFDATGGRNWWVGTGGIFAFCAYALNGFQTIPHAVEERAGHISLRTIGHVIVWSIGAAAAFYCLVVVAASVIVPWHRLVSEPLPMVAAARALPHGDAVTLILMTATAASLLKAWNGVFMMAARLLVAMARTGCVPAAFARLHPRFRSPALAVLAVGAFNIGGIFIGKAAIEPITDMSAMVLTLTYVLCCATVLRIRRTRARGQFQVPGGPWLVRVALVGSSLMAACALLAPLWQQKGLPLEWKLLAVWGVIGLGVWHLRLRGAGEGGSPHVSPADYVPQTTAPADSLRPVTAPADPGFPSSRGPS